MVYGKFLICYSICELFLFIPFFIIYIIFDAAQFTVCINYIKHLPARVEGIEITKTAGAIEISYIGIGGTGVLPTAVGSPYSGTVVKNKRTVAWFAILCCCSAGSFLKLRKGLLSVIVIVTLLINLEQTGDVFVGSFYIDAQILFRVE